MRVNENNNWFYHLLHDTKFFLNGGGDRIIINANASVGDILFCILWSQLERFSSPLQHLFMHVY